MRCGVPRAGAVPMAFALTLVLVLVLVLAFTSSIARGGIGTAAQAPPAPDPSSGVPAAAPSEDAVEATARSVETSGDGIEIVATRTKDVVEAGEPIEIVLELAVDGVAGSDARPDARGWQFGSADPSDIPRRPETLGAFDVLELPRFEAADPRTPGKLRGTLVLLVLDAGTQRPEPLLLRWRDGGLERSIEVALPSVEVTSALGEEIDPTKYRDIAGEVEIRTPLDLWPYAAGVLGALLLAALLWRLLRRPPRPVSPEAWALAELVRLERSDLPAAREFGAFYDALTGIVRGYVVRRFGIPADRQTTGEFVRSASAHAEFPAAERPRLQELLALADLVKFADATPDARECAAHLADARGFVERTRAIAPDQEAPR